MEFTDLKEQNARKGSLKIQNQTIKLKDKSPQSDRLSCHQFVSCTANSTINYYQERNGKFFYCRGEDIFRVGVEKNQWETLPELEPQ